MKTLWQLRVLIKSNARCLLVAVPLLMATVSNASTDEKSLKQHEERGIDEIARFTAREHSTILFSIADEATGFAKDGHVGWISSGHDHQYCGHPHPALSHDGLQVAFLTDGDAPEHCRIVIHDIVSGTQRDLIETNSQPGEISWSWDDSKIAFFENGIASVSVRDASRTVISIPMHDLPGGEFLFYLGWGPIQWMHDGARVIVELERSLPTKQLGAYITRFELFAVREWEAHSIAIGFSPAVSPVSDQIAFYSREGIVAINADGTGKTVLSKSPHGIFSREFPTRGIVWSPDATRLFCGTIHENLDNSLFLVDVKSGDYKRFLSHTSITIRGWR